MEAWIDLVMQNLLTHDKASIMEMTVFLTNVNIVIRIKWVGVNIFYRGNMKVFLKIKIAYNIFIAKKKFTGGPSDLATYHNLYTFIKINK